MKKIHYNKLIRDNIPDVMRRNGAAYKVKRLSKRAFVQALLMKVGEEASALPGQTKKSEIVSELGDVLDVIAALQEALNISSKDINAARRAALKRKGWFRKRLYLYWSQDTGYRTNERRYSRK